VDKTPNSVVKKPTSGEASLRKCKGGDKGANFTKPWLIRKKRKTIIMGVEHKGKKIYGRGKKCELGQWEWKNRQDANLALMNGGETCDEEDVERVDNKKNKSRKEP